MIDSFVKEAAILGEALCITAIYLGIGVSIYHGCTGRFPGEAEDDKGKVRKSYEPASGSSIWEIPLQ